MALLTTAFLLFAACGRAGDHGHERLLESLATVRPGEGRLVETPWREPATGAHSMTPAIREAVKATEDALREKVTAATLHQHAVAVLLGGKVDRAIDELSKAAGLEPSNATVWSDLSVAHLQRATTASDLYELVLALDAARRAVQLDSDLPAARFNRALALEKLSLQDRASAEWQEVRRTDSDPQWAREAGERLAALQQQEAASRNPEAGSSGVADFLRRDQPEEMRALVTASPQSTREYLEEKFLPAWAAAESSQQPPESAKDWTTARSLAGYLVDLGGDPMPAATLAQLNRTRTSDSAKYRSLVAGLGAYSEGLGLVAGGDFSKAISRFQAAEQRLNREGSPFSFWASYRIALCEYQRADYPAARDRLQALLQESRKFPYDALRGRALQMAGLINEIEGQHAAALDSFGAAESAFHKVKEMPNAAKASALIATELEALGKYEDAWRRLYPALIETASPGVKPDLRVSVDEYASWLARREGRTEIAVWFLDDALKFARGTGNPAAVVGVLRQRAELLSALGERTAAGEDLDQARTALQQIPDPAYRRTLEGDLLLAEAEFAAMASPQEVIAKLDQAIPIFRETSYHYRIGHALYLRATAEKSLGQTVATERDLSDAIAEVERQRETISDPRDRISYLDRLEGLFDSMIGLQLDQRKRPDAALRFSEQAKARVLWDWVLTSPSRQSVSTDLQRAAAPLDLKTLQAGLPEGTAVVEYAALPDRLVFWVLHREGEVKAETVPTSTATLQDLVQQFRRSLLDHDSGGLERISAQLYDLVVRPASRYLSPGERLVLIPDGPLHALPFSLLRDRQSGHYFVQDHALAVAPSLRVYLTSRRRDALLADGKPRALVVAAPDFDPEIDPSLTAQTYGPADAAIAGLFPGSRVIEGETATREAFLEAAGDFEIAHFGGHSVVNTESPLLSMMLFARNPADPARGVLYSNDVLRRKLPRTRLMVLASCGTASGRISRTEGVESLARPFLAAGVPTVVASLWSVNDQPTADFFSLFYRKLAQRFDPTGALQAAQVELIERSQGPAARPWTWGAFEVIGGGIPEESR